MSEAKGRGWHGDSEGHARAGRKGGKKSAGLKSELRRASRVGKKTS